MPDIDAEVCEHCEGTGEETVRADGFTFLTDCRWCPAGDYPPKDGLDDERGTGDRHPHH